VKLSAVAAAHILLHAHMYTHTSILKQPGTHILHMYTFTVCTHTHTYTHTGYQRTHVCIHTCRGARAQLLSVGYTMQPSTLWHSYLMIIVLVFGAMATGDGEAEVTHM
jgi:LPS O-antigen subunit length determinant protein (WzzB/FepE family)